MRKCVVLVQYDLPLTGMIVTGQFTTSVDNFFVVTWVMMHIYAFVIQSIDGILFAWSKFKNLIMMFLRWDTIKELGFTIVAR